MTTLGNRPATALLVIDVQNAAVDGSYQRDAVVANIGSLVEKARREHSRLFGFSIPMKSSRAEAAAGRSFRS